MEEPAGSGAAGPGGVRRPLVIPAARRPVRNRLLEAAEETIGVQELADGTTVAAVEEPGVEDDVRIPSDAEASLRLLLRQFPRGTGLTPPMFALKTQLYSVLRDRTAADRDLNELQRDQIARVFVLPTRSRPGGDAAVCLLEDVLAAARDDDAAAAADLERALRECPVEPIRRGRLVAALGLREGGAGAPPPEAALDRLLRAGWLARDERHLDAFRFSLPRAGRAVKAIDGGRKELLALVASRAFRGVLTARAAGTRQLRRSPLGVRWHLRDLEGCGRLQKRASMDGFDYVLARQAG